MFFFVLNISSDVLALPIFKQEESSLPSDNENKILPFQYVLCASTSPAVKLHEETLTYLNQGSHWAPTLCLALVFAVFLMKVFLFIMVINGKKNKFGKHLGSTYKVNEVYSHMKTKQKK